MPRQSPPSIETEITTDDTAPDIRSWPIRSPSIGEVEDPYSAHFHPGRLGRQPDGVLPVEGLQMSRGFEHRPAMVGEVVALLAQVPSGVIVDATVGGGGHARAVLDAHPHLTVLGIDRDPAAVAAASDALAAYGDRAVVRSGDAVVRVAGVSATRSPRRPAGGWWACAVSGGLAPGAGSGATKGW